ncbi:hypothetical protein llg_31260 [Luteolibacter sp. LG18]|nr:hypothetical protein llg_31260 [Luteolibacter sp. LG18]
MLVPTLGQAAVLQAVNSGGGAVAPFSADASFSGGGTYSSASTIATSGVVNPAPQSVYQSERNGNFTYTFGSLAPGVLHTVRLHFAELYHSAAGSRRFHVSINGAQVLTNFDIFAEAGGKNIAIVREFAAVANASGQIVVQFANGAADLAKSSGIEILEGVLYQVNSGGTAVAPFTADASFSGGSTYSTAAAINTGGVAGAAPQAVYQTERFGNFTYTLGSLGAGTTCTVRLHFAEIYHSAVGSRRFNVSINGTQVLANFDIFAAAGGKNIAIVREFAAVANASGQIVIQFANGAADQAKSSAFEVLSTPIGTAPVILAQPQSVIANAGASATLAATFGSTSSAPTYQWSRSADGLTFTDVAGATGPSLTLTASAANSGFYRVTATNAGGSVVSRAAHFGIPTTQGVTFAPANNATNLSIDQPLRLTFPSPPKLGPSGVLRIHDAATGAVVVSIDRSQFIGYTLFGGTLVNAARQTVQGKQMYYLPMAVYGNEVWVNLGVTQRLAYGKSYYVTMDPGLLVDSSNAAYPGITDTTAWRFSTRSAGPAAATATTGPAEITVGTDGAGDFATLQGAVDWIPQNNALQRTIRVKPGVYREPVYIGQNRGFVSLAGDGVDRQAVQLIQHYAAEVYGDGARGAGTLNIGCDDVTVRDMTIDNLAYIAQPNLAGAFAPPAAAFAGPINTLLTTGKRLVFDNVLIKGGQDTLYSVSGVAYFSRCEIWGSVDFIYGDALAVFDNCDIVQIRSTGGPITAPSTPYAQPYGMVFLNSRFPRALIANGYPYDVGVNTTNFMRPWRQDGATAIVNCQLGTHLTTKGWSEWGGREVTCRAREYGNTLIGGGAAPTPAQRQAAGAYWTNTLDPDYTGPPMTETAALVSSGSGTANRQAVIVDPAAYTLDAIFGNAYFNLGGWLPEAAPSKLSDGYGSAATGGQGGTAVTVTTTAQLLSYATSALPYIINVSGTIQVTGGAGSGGNRVDIKSNKTIQGVDGASTVIGTLNISTNNVIIRNLNITNPGTTVGSDGKYTDGGDGIQIWGGTNVHVSHCTLYDCADGCCDITQGADYITVAWCKFHYTAAALVHRFPMISGNTSTSRYRITLHHNWFAEGCHERMPSGSHNTVHLYNNYFSCAGNYYASDVRLDGRMVVQNNHYQGVNNPCTRNGGKAFLSGNLFASCTGNPGGYDTTAGTVTPNDPVFMPPYFHLLDDTANIAALVTAGAGNPQAAAVIPPADSLTAWRSANFTSGQISAGLANLVADPDGDGLSNLAEYALGADPGQKTPLPAAVRDGSGLTLTFTRPKGLPGVTYIGESTEDFTAWTTLPLEILQSGDPETIRVRDPLAGGNPKRRFLRLRFQFTAP